MSILGKLFGKKVPDTRTALAKWVDTLTTQEIKGKIKNMDREFKAPYAIAMTVYIAARGFMQALDSLVQDMPEPFRVKHPIAHDKMFSEVASFCYFAISAEAYPVLNEKEYMDEHYENADDDDEDDPMTSDPYYSTIRLSAILAGKLFQQITEIDRVPEFLVNRAFSYRHKMLFGKDVNIVEEFMQRLSEQWIPEEARPRGISLELANPGLVLMPLITKLPLDDLQAGSRWAFTKYK